MRCRHATPTPTSERTPKDVVANTHGDDSRRNIPTAELEPVMADADRLPVRVAYQRRNRDLDPQLVWRGKDEQDDRDLVVAAPPLFTQEKVHPKALVDDLMRLSRRGQPDDGRSSTSSPTSTACTTPTPAPSSTSTTRTGPTA